MLAFSSPNDAIARKNQPFTDEAGQGLLFTGNILGRDGATRPDIIFADFSSGTYDGWTTKGDAFGSAPVARKDLPAYLAEIGGKGDYIVTSHNFRNHRSIAEADDLTGTLTSKQFQIERNFIEFYSSGGHRPGKTGVRLLIDGQPVLEQTGDDKNRLTLRTWDVSNNIGKTAQIQIFDLGDRLLGQRPCDQLCLHG